MNPDWEAISCTDEAARLLPWYLVGRLSAVDLDRVARHLEHCAICRDDLSRETAVRASLTADEAVEYAPQAGLRKTLSRIDELSVDGPATASSNSAMHSTVQSVVSAAPRRPGALRWLTAAVVMQALALGWLGLSGSRGRPAPVTGYQTLSSERPSVAGPAIRAVFAPTMTLADLRVLLRADHLVVVGGPSESGAFTLMAYAADAADPHATLAVLRGDPRVLFAEPVINESLPP